MIDTVLRALRVPRQTAVASNTVRVENWLRKHSERVGASPMLWPGLWTVSDDTDGSVLLVPLCETDPGLAIMPACGGGYEVLICDPDDMDEIGPFETIEQSMGGIARWFALPCRSIDVLADFADRHPPTSRLQ